jgi:signal transduction histidine kinase
MNLVHNALDATPDGGPLIMELYETLVAHPDQPERIAPFVVLSVTDSGVGMTVEVEQRMFEPFFTTKEGAKARGRGLGLSIVLASVRKAGGFVHVQTQPGEGTTIRVHFPAARPTPGSANPARLATGSLMG